MTLIKQVHPRVSRGLSEVGAINLDYLGLVLSDIFAILAI